MTPPYDRKWRRTAAAAAAKLLQLCPTLWDPIDGSSPGSTIPGILQTRTLEWVTISFSNAWKWKVKGKSLRHVRLFVTPWTTAYQAPLPMGFSRQEYWSGVPLPSSEEELKSLNESERGEWKSWLKLNIQKTKIMASGPITSWQIDGETVETMADFSFLGSKVTQMVTAAMKLKDTYSLEEKLWPT